MTTITLDNLKKAYGETVIMEDMNFTINSGERLVLLGPSGCGKSTILRMIAGIEEITSGEMRFNDAVINDVTPGERNVAMVFQNYALYPHMTVEENITYGLRVNKVPEERIRERFEEVIDALDLRKYLERKPAELSGGQRQRVALARATVKDSSVFLLDEPLSNLDAQLRVSARESLTDIHERYGQTIVYVTHDQTEAMTFGDRIALLNFGELQMIDTPENIYHKPANIFTARFIGNPPMNVLENSRYAEGQIIIGSQGVEIAPSWVDYINTHANGQALYVGIRPENIGVSLTDTQNTLRGVVRNIENQGSNYANYIDLEGEIICAVTDRRVAEVGDTVYLTLDNARISFFEQNSTNNIGYPVDIEATIEKITGIHA
ncbi:sugar ABC transporter ATP-binding protein [Suicoccus acidiformans]|uniref:Sugar ABC transporter ATP-binding protein n=1 Tax=Suicoccus acidiformans TaxID=2036206 RepID=A0A347WHR6_9LACT|nr:ABC transporter ATP-binding protein [Suicoccus acidiformans]AXY24623.1 sugar ABC transporter ATP-binding protein [Suicoccus acidiformans]